ncbi:MAG: hypothetical protein AAF683_04095 [Pseudomonadota bacterium]
MTQAVEATGAIEAKPKAPKPTKRNGLSLSEVLRQQDEAQAVIDAETARRGAVTADGGQFDPSKLRAAQQQLTDMQEAEAELTRRERAAQAAEEAKHRAQQERQAHEMADQWISILDRIQDHAERMVDAIVEVEAVQERLRKTIYDLTEKSPSILEGRHARIQRGGRFSELVIGRVGRRALGYVRLHSGLPRQDPRWSAEERQFRDDLTNFFRLHGESDDTP